MHPRCCHSLSAAEAAACNAPFPAEAYYAGARAFPTLVVRRSDDPAVAAIRQFGHRPDGVLVPIVGDQIFEGQLQWRQPEVREEGPPSNQARCYEPRQAQPASTPSSTGPLNGHASGAAAQLRFSAV